MWAQITLRENRLTLDIIGRNVFQNKMVGMAELRNVAGRAPFDNYTVRLQSEYCY